MVNKYGNVLTMILVVFIVAIIGIVGYFAYDLISANGVNSNAQTAIEEFEKSTKSVKKNKDKNENKVETPVEDVANPLDSYVKPQQEVQQQEEPEKVYMEDYQIMGKIEIPKTNVSYPILDQVTRRSIEIAVGIAYGPGLNEVGNTVIYGHNYRNGLFFSNNKKLSNGDLVYITDRYNNRVTYEIYKVYQTDENDATYFTRDTGGRREISLQTCTDDSKARIVIWAAEKQ